MTMTMPNVSRVETVSTPSVRNSTRMPVRSAPTADGTTPRCAVASPSFAGAPDRTAPTQRGMVAVASAAENERAAVNHSDGTPPTRPMDSAANAGPTMVTSESSDCDNPMNRWRSTSSCLVTAGSSASRAVMPGMSPTAPSRPSATNHQKFSPHIISTMGMSAMLAADTRSEAMDMVRRLKRSSAAPPTMPMAIWGTAQMSASVPAASASPVVASKMSGSATAAMEFPSRESAFDTRNLTDVRPNMRGPFLRDPSTARLRRFDQDGNRC